MVHSDGFGASRSCDRANLVAQHVIELGRGLFAPGGLDHLACEGHVRALIAKDPGCARGEVVQEPVRAQEVHVREGAEEEEHSMQAAKQMRFRRNCRRFARHYRTAQRE